MKNHTQDPWRAIQYRFAAGGRAPADPSGLIPDQKQQKALSRKEASCKSGTGQCMRLCDQLKYLISFIRQTPLLPGGDRTQVTRWHGDRTQQALTMQGCGRCWEAAIRAGAAQSLQAETFVKRISGWKAIWKDVVWLIQYKTWAETEIQLEIGNYSFRKVAETQQIKLSYVLKYMTTLNSYKQTLNLFYL